MRHPAPPPSPPPTPHTHAQAVFFKMRVAGVLHIFQFESKQGEDICMSLQTHINDIMMKRYSKAKAAQEGDGPGGGDGAGGADFGPKYQAHVSEMQRQLDEARELLEAKEREVDDLREERQSLADELTALKGGEGGLSGAAAATFDLACECLFFWGGGAGGAGGGAGGGPGGGARAQWVTCWGACWGAPGVSLHHPAPTSPTRTPLPPPTPPQTHPMHACSPGSVWH